MARGRGVGKPCTYCPCCWPRGRRVWCELPFWWNGLSSNNMNLWAPPATWALPFLPHSLLGQSKAERCLPSTQAFSTSSRPTARWLLPGTSHYKALLLSFFFFLTFIKSLRIFLPPAHSSLVEGEHQLVSAFWWNERVKFLRLEQWKSSLVSWFLQQETGTVLSHPIPSAFSSYFFPVLGAFGPSQSFPMYLFALVCFWAVTQRTSAAPRAVWAADCSTDCAALGLCRVVVLVIKTLWCI